MTNIPRIAAIFLLAFMFFVAGGAALHESAAVDEIAHVGAGLSYLQRLDFRLNPEHPPLGKMLAALPLVLRGTHADYTSPSWTLSADFLPAFMAQWAFGDAVLGRWNPWKPTLMWARLPRLLLTLLLGWVIFIYGNRLGGPWGGLLCVAAYVTTPAFLVFGPLVITDLPVTHFTLIALWLPGQIWASLSDPAIVVPETKIWDCRTATDQDAGQWVAISAVSISENHNCGYLQQYPSQKLAGGSFYAWELPAPIPAPGPPIESERNMMWGMPFDLRAFAITVERPPEQLEPHLQVLIPKFQDMAQPPKK